MPKKILGAVSIGTRTYVAGEEAELAKAMQAEKVDVDALAETGAISGNWGASESEADELPTLDELEKHIASMDAKEVRAMKRKDERKGAEPIYAARLDAIKAGE